MSKNFFQDMVKIKNENREKQKQKVQGSVAPSRSDTSIPIKALIHRDRGSNIVTERPDNKKKQSKRGLWLVAIISIIFFVFSISYLFLKVVVTVNPKMQDMELNESLSASLDQDGSTETLPFDLIVISGEEEKIVETIKTEEKNISEKAKGVVLIYNTFSSATQRLDIDTRLLGSNGKIYKTEKQIFVPGMKGNTPGSVEVGIYATEAGEEYNSGPLDFTIVGFKGTPKYDKFKAISNINDATTKGEIRGGFKGKAPFISDSQKTNLINEVKITLQEKLFKKAIAQIPNGVVLFKDAVFVDIDEGDIDFSSSENNMSPLKIKGTLYGFLFDEEKLVKKVMEDNPGEGDDSDVYMPNIRDLTFSLSNKDNASFADVKNINFNLKGNAKIVWKLDENKLMSDLLGKSKKDFSQVLLQYPNVDSADLVVSPFWKMSLPDSKKDIKIIVNYPK